MGVEIRSVDRLVCSRASPVPKGEQISIERSTSRESPSGRFIVADAYTYGNVRDRQRAFAEASFELAGGLNMPRVHVIFASAYLVLGNQLAAAADFRTHIELVTTQLVQAAPLTAVATLKFPLVLGAELRNSRSCHGRGGALDPDEQPQFL